MKVRPFMLVGASALDSVQAALSQAMRRWALDWGLDSAQVSVQSMRAWEYSGPAVIGTWSGVHTAKGSAYLAWHAQLAASLERMLFSPDPGPVITAAPHFAKTGAAAASAALTAAIGTAIALSPSEPADDVVPASSQYDSGSGAVLAVIAIGAAHSHVLLDGDYVRALALLQGVAQGVALPALAPVDLRQALATVPVGLTLTVGATQVSLGKLMALEVGDVIRLNSSIEQPVALTVSAGAALLTGFLGTVDGQLAVELTRSH